MVEDGESGDLVDPGDPAALVHALSWLVEDPGLRAQMGARGRARAESESAWDRVAERIAGLLVDAIGSRQP